MSYQSHDGIENGPSGSVPDPNTTDLIGESNPTTNADTEKAGRYKFVDTICVLSGPEQVPFNIHPAVIGTDSTSRFIQKAASDAWKKADEQPIDLPNIEPSVFDEYLRWAYKGLHESEAVTKGDFYELILVYIAADYLRDLGTANLVIDAILECSNRHDIIPGIREISLIYRDTPENSPLRMLVRDLYVWEAAKETFDDVDKDAAPEFFQDLAYEIPKVRELCRILDPADRIRLLLETNPCHYHQHDTLHPVQCEYQEN